MMRDKRVLIGLFALASGVSAFYTSCGVGGLKTDSDVYAPKLQPAPANR